MRLGFLSSHGGSTARAVTAACRKGELHAVPALLISNNSTSPVMQWAAETGLARAHLSSAAFPNPDELDAAILRTLRHHDIDTVVLSGYMKALGPRTLGAYRGRLLNVHPSLLPLYGGRGMYGDLVHAAVLAAGERVSGATVHQVDAGIDEGEVVAQSRVEVHPGDTVATLRARVQATEGPLMIEALRALALAAGKPT
ncbi:phosphoribosylglycinamide formyltransferase [Deinococcus irradiatisoli]|uniref:Phosphoribosylglycinamide formyltransferase n=1 Tax=Deinococcus irradiatisoli TaxID=2202254 RepID=A0A2Z3JJC2_9DEIO|nr:phosphoribosylglycinamide formyltransferase [Deinococcus irradiatisoli]AWN23019.1 phosphoribosylglycinamide formyltransferase [Deinococcus irradiatisoli]